MKLKSFKLSLFVVGTIIGAGFASGKEIATFFTRFGGIIAYCKYVIMVQFSNNMTIILHF